MSQTPIDKILVEIGRRTRLYYGLINNISLEKMIARVSPAIRHPRHAATRLRAMFDSMVSEWEEQHLKGKLAPLPLVFHTIQSEDRLKAIDATIPSFIADSPFLYPIDIDPAVEEAIECCSIVSSYLSSPSVTKSASFLTQVCLERCKSQGIDDTITSTRLSLSKKLFQSQLKQSAQPPRRQGEERKQDEDPLFTDGQSAVRGRSRSRKRSFSVTDDDDDVNMDPSHPSGPARQARSTSRKRRASLTQEDGMIRQMPTEESILSVQRGLEWEVPRERVEKMLVSSRFEVGSAITMLRLERQNVERTTEALFDAFPATPRDLLENLALMHNGDYVRCYDECRASITAEALRVEKAGKRASLPLVIPDDDAALEEKKNDGRQQANSMAWNGSDSVQLEHDRFGTSVTADGTFHVTCGLDLSQGIWVMIDCFDNAAEFVLRLRGDENSPSAIVMSCQGQISFPRAPAMQNVEIPRPERGRVYSFQVSRSSVMGSVISISSSESEQVLSFPFKHLEVEDGSDLVLSMGGDVQWSGSPEPSLLKIMSFEQWSSLIQPCLDIRSSFPQWSISEIFGIFERVAFSARDLQRKLAEYGPKHGEKAPRLETVTPEEIITEFRLLSTPNTIFVVRGLITKGGVYFFSQRREYIQINRIMKNGMEVDFAVKGDSVNIQVASTLEWVFLVNTFCTSATTKWHAVRAHEFERLLDRACSHLTSCLALFEADLKRSSNLLLREDVGGQENDLQTKHFQQVMEARDSTIKKLQEIVARYSESIFSTPELKQAGKYSTPVILLQFRHSKSLSHDDHVRLTVRSRVTGCLNFALNMALELESETGSSRIVGTTSISQIGFDWISSYEFKPEKHRVYLKFTFKHYIADDAIVDLLHWKDILQQTNESLNTRCLELKLRCIRGGEKSLAYETDISVVSAFEPVETQALCFFHNTCNEGMRLCNTFLSAPLSEVIRQVPSGWHE